jgi:DNA-binding beta-propeller fold protein YncE
LIRPLALFILSASLCGCDADVPTPIPEAAAQERVPKDREGADDPGEAKPKPTGPKRQPNGVPFPLPSELPSARVFETPTPAPKPGPEPLAFWVGGSGTEDGHFNYPRAIATGHDGSVFIVDKSGRIQKWSPEGRLLAITKTPAIAQGKPTGLGIDPEGNLLVADTHYCRVLTYSAELEFLGCYGSPGPEAGQFMLITCVRQGEGGLHYITDYGDLIARVQVLKSDGTPVRTFGTFGDGPDQFDRPMALCVDDARDRLYVADAVNHRISVFTREGKHLTAFGESGKAPGQLQYPYDVKLDSDGRVWVAEFGNQRVSVFSPEGATLGTWGGPSRRVGGLNRSWGLTLVPGGRLWVLDSGCDRAYALDRTVVLGESGG